MKLENPLSGQESPDDRHPKGAAIRLLVDWLREDQKGPSDDGAWQRLKAELDLDRLSERRLFS